MKTSALLILLVFLSYACGERNKAQVIKFEIYSTSQYCGGAAPSDELIEELKKPVKSNDTLYIHQGPDRNSESVMLILNDGKGKLVGLATGSYRAYRFSAEKIKQIEMSPDPEAGCLMSFYSNPAFDFQVEPETEMVKDTFTIECNPCVLPSP